MPLLPHLLLDIIPLKVRNCGGLTSGSSQTLTQTLSVLLVMTEELKSKS